MLLLIISLFVLLFLGVPIAYSLGMSSLLYFMIEQPMLAGILLQRFFAGLENYATGRELSECLRGDRPHGYRSDFHRRRAVPTGQRGGADTDLPFPTTCDVDPECGHRGLSVEYL